MMKKIIGFCMLALVLIHSAAFADTIPGGISDTLPAGTAAGMSAGGPNGAGPGEREPKYYEATDKVFLGNWECTSDMNSKLTIKEANPQTGGYYADFFFYRLAHADGYANISGDKLSINQGSANDDQNFRGIFEKTQNGIRFTVTESGFNYLKPGDMFEYKKMSGKPSIADSDIFGTWGLRSWVNATVVRYVFTDDNRWTAYAPQWVGPDPKPKTDEKGVLKQFAAGSYKVMHEGNFDPIFKLYDATGTFYAYVSIEYDENAGCKMLSINGRKSWFCKENAE